jgi:hypothetical protein
MSDRPDDELLTVKEAAKLLKLYKRDGVTLNPKRVYELHVRRHKVPGVGVRIWKSDLLLYINLRAA